MSKLDLSKEIPPNLMTKAGYPVRILCINKKGGNPVVGLWTGDDGEEHCETWKLDGRIGVRASLRGGMLDLVARPVIEYEYQNVYENGASHATRVRGGRCLPACESHGDILGYLVYTFTDGVITDVKFIKEG